jgi:hypothetical protein
VGFGFFMFFHSPYTLKIPRFVPLFHTKTSPLFLSFSLPKTPPESVICFSSSPKFCHHSLLVPPLVFISRGGEGHFTPTMAQGKVDDVSFWQGMVSYFLHHGGMGL